MTKRIIISTVITLLIFNPRQFQNKNAFVHSFSPPQFILQSPFFTSMSTLLQSPPPTSTSPTTFSSSSRSYNSKLYQSNIPILDDWSVNYRGGLNGIVSNHPSPDIEDGELLVTSKLATMERGQLMEGAIVVTLSGSQYRLGSKKGGGTSVKGGGGGARRGQGVSSSSSSQQSNFFNMFTPKNGFESTSSSKEGKSPPPDRYSAKPSFQNPFAAMFNSNKISSSSSSSSSSTPVNTKPETLNILVAAQDFFNFGNFQIPATVTKPKPSSSTSSTSSQPQTSITPSFTTPTNAPTKPKKRQQKPSLPYSFSAAAKMRELTKRYGLTGKTISNGKYLLVRKPQRSTSGKSLIWSAYATDNDGFPIEPKLVIKVSPNYEALSIENDNYNKITSGLFSGRFVQKLEYLPELNGDPPNQFVNQCALVIESGRKDMKALLNERNQRGLEGRALRDAAVAVAQCVQAVHSSGMVWTDLKSENFVICDNGGGGGGSSDELMDSVSSTNSNTDDDDDETQISLNGVKGIDLESARPYKSNPVDFSPEACPPEFAQAFMNGEGLEFVLDYSYDIWSMGMMLYEISTGTAYFAGKSPGQITNALQVGSSFQVDVSKVKDVLLRDLISKCLQTNPRKRPSIGQVLLHPYFLTTGVGPFGF